MYKQGGIPLYDGNAYLKESEEKPVSQRAVSLQHFDLHYKCEWKNVIPAHRLKFFMVVLVMEGEGILKIGATDYYITRNSICFVPPNIITSWQTELEAHKGYFCTFSEDFFNVGRTDKHYLSGRSFFQPDGTAVLQLSNEQMDYYVTLFKLIEIEAKSKDPQTYPIIRSHLHALLDKSSIIAQAGEVTETRSNQQGLRLLKEFTTAYMKDFKALEEGHVVRLKKISAYADELGVAQNHLNDTIKAITGKSAGQLIRQQLINYATACLKNSTETIAEIAYKFGFEDPSYFSRFYKSHTGKSPSEIN